MDTRMNGQTRVHDDVVVLVPGFLGFSVVGQFPYFADRVAATIAALIRERWDRAVSVVPATTVPSGRLRNRIETLATLLGDLGARGASRLHLIGHSTGGVDAQLLMTETPFWGGRWPDEMQTARERVKSVVTLSAPHYGTSLLDSAAAKFLAHPTSWHNVKGILPLLEAAGPLAGLMGKDLPQILSLADVSAMQFPDVIRFVDSVLRHHELFDELTPKAMAAVREKVKADPRAKLTLFVTGADVATGGRKSDPFYAELNGFGRVDDESPSPTIRGFVQQIANAEPAVWIHNPATPKFPIGPGTNDGIVNTARQLVPEGALRGIVVGDHADVLGHYDRIDLSTGKPLNTGVFRSGAGFGDDEFLELYRRVARELHGGA